MLARNVWQNHKNSRSVITSCSAIRHHIKPTLPPPPSPPPPPPPPPPSTELTYNVLLPLTMYLHYQTNIDKKREVRNQRLQCLASLYVTATLSRQSSLLMHPCQSSSLTDPAKEFLTDFDQQLHHTRTAFLHHTFGQGSCMYYYT